jgi:hypothetical protein
MKNNSLRILHLNTGARQSGMQTAFLQVVHGLSKQGVPQRVLCHEEDANALAGLPLIQTDVFTARHPLKDWFNHIRLRREIWHFRPSVIQLWSHKVAWFLMPRWPHRPTCVFLGGMPWPSRLRRLRRVVDTWLVPAEATRHEMVEAGIADASIGRLFHFPDVVDAVPASREPFCIPDDHVVAVCAGRLFAHKKGLDILIQALAIVPGITLLLAGDGPDEAMLRALAVQHGVAERVRFLGWRSDVANLFAMADIAVMPSRYEPFGFVMLEAMAQGTPLILTNVKGPDEVAKNNQNSLTVPPENIDELAAALRTLRDDPALRKKLGAAGRQTIRDPYNEETSMQHLIAFYQRMVAA